MLDDLYGVTSDLGNEGIFFCLSGPMSQELLVEIGGAIKNKMLMDEASKSTMSQVFSIIVEMVQNIIFYSDEKLEYEQLGETSSCNVGLIAVGEEKDSYFVMSGNMIKNEKVNRLKNRIEKLVAMSKDELKKFYKEQRRAGPDEYSKGAGLGYIEMARKTSRPLGFEFREIDENMSFFSIITYV